MNSLALSILTRSLAVAQRPATAACQFWPGLYLECSGRGCNGRAGSHGGRLGEVQCNIVPIKTGFCASSVCISLLKHALKLKRNTVDLLLLHIAHTLGYFIDDEGVWIGSDEGVSSEVGVYTLPLGICITYWFWPNITARLLCGHCMSLFITEIFLLGVM